MKKQNFGSSILSFLLLALIGAAIYSCANMALPTGGAYDIDPPKVIKATPDFNTLEVKKRKIVIEFDENIKIEKPNEKVIITPPQQNMPIIKSIGKKAVVELQDDLIDDITYTIDFTDAIVDNNEGNPLENFSLSFSTGKHIDTLMISGRVLTAENLEPVSGIYVGLHSDLTDTVFTNQPFRRIGRTDSRGRFSVKGVAEGKYKIYALNDKNRDFKYDNPQEDIAFIDSIFIPSFEPAVRQDTIYNPMDSTVIDTIKTVHYTRFMPDDIVLRSFVSDFHRQYLQKSERPQPHKLVCYFAAPTQKPTFSLIKPIPRSQDDWYVDEISEKNDTLTLWITDSLIYKQDSIQLKIDYIRTDTLNEHRWVTDTLNFNLKKKKETKSKRKSDKGEAQDSVQIHFMDIDTNIGQSLEIYQPIYIEFEQPLAQFDTASIKLLQLKDSLYHEIKYALIKDSLNGRKFTLRKRWEPGGKYKFYIDSAAFVSRYGYINKKMEKEFQVKKLDEYGNLKFVLSGLPQDKPVYVELLNSSDKPFRKVRVKNNEALFMDLTPGKVYARLFIDDNEDGIWTTGDYNAKRPPEMVYYYPYVHEVRAFTDYEQTWNVTERPLHRQKPLEITKNKAQEKKRRNPNLERERQRQQQSRGSGLAAPMPGGMGGSGARQGNFMQR